MQATARRLSVVSATSCARRRLIRSVRPRNGAFGHRRNRLLSINGLRLRGLAYPHHMTVFKRPFKDTFLFLLLCYAGWSCMMKELQWAFIFCCVLATMIIYKHPTTGLINQLMRLVLDAETGKVAGFEFKRRNPMVSLPPRLADRYPAHARLLSELSANHLSILMHVVKEPGTKARSGQHDILRDLRTHGLVTSHGRIGDNSPIEPTAFGSELASMLRMNGTELLEPKIDQDVAPTPRIDHQ